MELGGRSGNSSTYLPTSQAAMNDFVVRQEDAKPYSVGNDLAANQRLRPLPGHAVHATEDPNNFFSLAEHRTEAVLQQPLHYRGNAVSFDFQHGAVDNPVPILPQYTYTRSSTGHSRLDEFPGAIEFDNFSGLDQSGTGQSGCDQVDGARAIVNFQNDEQTIGFDFPPISYNSTSTLVFNTPIEYDITTGNNYFSENPAFPDSLGDASVGVFVPPTQFTAGDVLGGLIGVNFVSDPNTLTAPTIIDEGQPMTQLPIMQPDATVSLGQTIRTPFHPLSAGLSKRRQKRGVRCPEGCGIMLSRRYDIDRHVAQKHAEATLCCPVDGCIKLFSRHDKRLDHLKKGHKLGANDIDMLFAANLGEEKM